MITQQQLKAWLDYDELTGDFYWRRSPGGGVLAGSKAGSINTQGYLQIQLGGILYLGHKLAWFYAHGEWAKVDHEDLNRANIKLINLRKCNQSQNIANSPISVANTSGYKGVSFNKRLAKYQAYIKVNYKRFHLGYFEKAEDASVAYITAAQKHFGAFARTK